VVTRALRLAALLALGLLSGACAQVQPWQKDVLSQPRMQFRSQLSGRKFVAHAAITMEQAEGGDGSVGGGCGCR
jgi:hypothetical protein